MSQFHPHRCLFVYESLIITTAKNTLVLNEQTYRPSFPYSLSPPTLKQASPPSDPLLSPDLFSCPERVFAGEEKRDIAVVFPPPVLICSSLMLPSHLSHLASGEYRQRAATTHAQCGKVVHSKAQPVWPRGSALTVAKLKVKFNHSELGLCL